MVTPGTRLGPYEIVASLAAGGMGEIYRARDPRLGREVAVKLIAGDGSASPERVRRFEQEARAVAGLEHPHILAIHDVGIHEGRTYIVFEQLEGETLRDRLQRGALPSRKAVELAAQMCQGLAAAHARGIVHRDLKPENIFLTRDGRVKILDFGLAKLTQAPEEDGSQQPTQTATDVGAWVGTPGYVSPEQLRGAPADARSDLFALGAVFYEMLTGQRAFRGATRADTLSAILERDPPGMTVPGGQVLPSLERLVRRCLEKDPEERFQSARDVGFALETLIGPASSEAVAIEARPAPPWRWPRAGALLALVAAVAGAGGLLAGRDLWQGPAPTFKQLTFRRGWISYARFAPDGRTVLYAASWDGKPLRSSRPAPIPQSHARWACHSPGSSRCRQPGRWRS
jgi:serine/threonine protein kinase